jgi:hypothetical protein
MRGFSNEDFGDWAIGQTMIGIAALLLFVLLDLLGLLSL